MMFSDSGVKKFEGTVAVATDGSRGIGKSIPDKLIEKGARIGTKTKFADVGLDNNKLDILDDSEESLFDVNSIGVIEALMHMAKMAEVQMYYNHSYSKTSAYNTSKYAVVGYVRSSSITPAVCNVRVNAATNLLVGFTFSSSTVDPLVEAMNAFPFVAMSDVVKGVFTFLYDESRNAHDGFIRWP
ncbi:hypothetical protein MFLAVUS_002873 [Mucor flavus]|uniref:Uncharacterized protein n=1 Tax=Mucor flavus TaxID=439312 RepID=A0ABP9YRL0_9FUNG